MQHSTDREGIDYLMDWIEIAPLCHYAVFAMVAFACLSVLLRGNGDSLQTVAAPRGIGVVLVFVSVVLLIAFWPDELSSDKINYRNTFENLAAGTHPYQYQPKDILFFTYQKLCAATGMPSDAFFLLTSAIFCTNFFIAGKRIFREQSSLYFFAMTVSLGFFSYGTNTLRAGLALSFLALALSFYPQKLKMLLLAVIAVGIHKSTLIPIAAFATAFFVQRPRLLAAGWLGCLCVSLAFGEQIQSYFGEFFIEAEDTRVSGYLLNENSGYKTGFRWDFIAYSLIPIVIGLWMRKREFFNDRFFNLVFGTYIVANGFWLLVIRMPFSDRVAYLSWFLFPLVILYPLLKYPKFVLNTRILVPAAIFCMGTITVGIPLFKTLS